MISGSLVDIVVMQVLMLLDTFKIVIVMYDLALLCYQGQLQTLLTLSRYFIA